MINKRKFNPRFIPLYVLYVAAVAFFIIKLVNVQITGADYYKGASVLTHEREEVIQSMRGEIYDRNGVPLVTNEYTQSVALDYNALPSKNADKNEALKNLIKVLSDCGKDIETVMPVLGTYPHVEYDKEALSDSTVLNRFERFLRYHNCLNTISCIDLYEELLSDFGLVDKSGEHIYDAGTEDKIMRLRYSLDATDFAPDNPYVVLADAELSTVTAVRENGCKGVYIKKDGKRVNNVPGVASSVIGRVGKIPADKIDEYLKNGYSYDATVGVSGAELAFEDVLRGVDGVRVYIEDEYGTVVGTYVKKEAVPGKNVYLTIDIELQKVAEQALSDQIAKVRAAGIASGEKDNGEKADSGAVTVFSAKTGQVLALATYPSYDLTTFSEEYAALSTDPAKPLLDRALNGHYQPGSTFKLATSIAGLMSGTITKYTTVYDHGKYTYYEDYQPSCWLKSGHGKIDLETAIGVSCNVYFYDTGRKVGIETLNKYCRSLGLGEYTGIELSESKGVLAGPESKEASGQNWMPGDTLQAAIGQSDNSFTPLQLSSYIATAVNGGKRFKATILYKTCNYSGEDEAVNEPVLIEDMELPESVTNVIKHGMRNSKDWTSDTKSYKFDIGTKTGTAQTSQTNNNAVLVAFAPYKDPEITLSCVIENGAKGGNAAAPVLAAISQYYNLDAKGNPLPEKTAEDTELTVQ